MQHSGTVAVARCNVAWTCFMTLYEMPLLYIKSGLETRCINAYPGSIA